MSDIILIMMLSGFSALAGIVSFVNGFLMFNNRKKKEINCTSKTYGKVTDIVRHEVPDGEGGYSSAWYPVFEYNIGELKFIKEYAYGFYQSEYTIGQDVEIYYNPKDYNEYYIAGDALPKTVALLYIISGIGLIISAIGFAIIIKQ